MKAELDLSGYEPQVITSSDGKHFIIRCEQVDQPPTGPIRTGKYIHLGMTAADAMRLLGLLEGARKQHGLLVQTNVTLTAVPPEKDRH